MSNTDKVQKKWKITKFCTESTKRVGNCCVEKAFKCKTCEKSFAQKLRGIYKYMKDATLERSYSSAKLVIRILH